MIYNKFPHLDKDPAFLDFKQNDPVEVKQMSNVSVKHAASLRIQLRLTALELSSVIANYID